MSILLFTNQILYDRNHVKCCCQQLLLSHLLHSYFCCCKIYSKVVDKTTCLWTTFILYVFVKRNINAVCNTLINTCKIIIFLHNICKEENARVCQNFNNSSILKWTYSWGKYYNAWVQCKNYRNFMINIRKLCMQNKLSSYINI